jgi:hypothetical protein
MLSESAPEATRSVLPGLLPGLAVILDMRPVDPVVALPMEYAELTACTSLHDREVIEQVDGPVVQPHMTVRAQDVLGDVRARDTAGRRLAAAEGRSALSGRRPARLGWGQRHLGLLDQFGGPNSSMVEVAAAPPAVRLRPELAFQLHQAPDPDAVGAEAGLHVGARLLDGGQVDAEQLRALLQRRRDRPAQVRVVPSPTETGEGRGQRRLSAQSLDGMQGVSGLGLGRIHDQLGTDRSREEARRANYGDCRIPHLQVKE